MAILHLLAFAIYILNSKAFATSNCPILEGVHCNGSAIELQDSSCMSLGSAEGFYESNGSGIT